MIKNRKWTCPYCPTGGTGDARFRTHLKGKSGHGLSEEKAALVIRKATLGLTVPDLVDLNGTEAPSSRAEPVDLSTLPAAALQPGHHASLELLENTRAVQTTLQRYASTMGAPVYLRPTEKGLTAMLRESM